MNRGLAVATILALSAPMAHADEADMGAGKDWAVQVTPYLWATGLDGNISPFRRAPVIGVDKSFSDVMEDLNFGGFINLWARCGPWVLSGDLMYSDTTGAHGFGAVPPLPVPPGTPITADIDTRQFTATLQGGYRIIDSGDFTFDALGGLRYWHISNKVTVSALGLSRSYKESFGWVDPLIGARLFKRLNERLSLQAQADIGGFGVGANLTWSLLATVNYTFSDRFSAAFGYKVLDVDYDHDGHVFDTQMRGPVLGLTYRF